MEEEGRGHDASAASSDHDATQKDHCGRMTRSRLASPITPPHVRQKLQQQNTDDPPHMDSDALYAHVTDLFPARSPEIRQILGLIGEPCDPLLPIFIYGGAATGKTSILLEMFRRLKRPFAYTSCRSSHAPRILFESILNQLHGHVRSSANNFGSVKKCDKLGDFLSFLPDACLAAIATKGGKASCEALHSLDKQVQNTDREVACSLPIVYLIFDNVELLLHWSGGFRLISALVRLAEFSQLQNLGVIFISSLGPDAFFTGTGILEPLPVYMRDYTDDDLHQILLRRKPNRDLYSSFLNAVLKPFSRVTRRVNELSEALEPLFQKYVEPITRGTVKPDDNGKRMLFSLIQPRIAAGLHQICGFSYLDPPKFSCSEHWKGSMHHVELCFQLSLCSKYLLISAFICSRNPATLDATLFDSNTEGNKKRKRKGSQASMEKKDLERQEKVLKGPGTFPLERLLAIFCCISAEFVDDTDETETGMLTCSEVKHGIEISSDVLMQISTLVKSNLLYKGASDPLESTPRYRCNVNEDLVQMVARSISFPLSRYLYRM